MSGVVTGYTTKTITLTRRDGTEISFDFQDLSPASEDTLDMVTTRGNNTVNIINVGGVSTPWVDLDTSYSNGNVIGRISWDQDNATMDVGLNENTILKVGQDDMWYVKNQTGSSIPKGTAVMAVGTLGASGRILVAPMVADGSVSPKYLLGITAEIITNGSDGYVLAKGKLRQVNTSAYTDGQVLWCSPTTPGTLTATEPQAPNLKLPIAFVVNAANNGVLAIRANPGETLSENSQIQFGTLANNDVLTYVSANGRWQNVPISTIASTLAFSTIAVTGQPSIVAETNQDTLNIASGTAISLTTNASTDTLTITNTAPDQIVSLTGTGTTTITGTYPNFTINSDDQYDGTVTSVALTAPSAFTVTGSPITTSGTIALGAAGTAAQYIRGDGQLGDFPTTGGGGSSVSYYLNGSVNQGTFGGNPEFIAFGTTISQYYTALAVPQTTLAVTDRLALRIYVIHSGRTITLHTEDNHLCQVITTFSTGLNALNGLTKQVQYFATGTSGTDFNISSVTDTHTFNLPTASALNRGALSSADWITFNGKADFSFKTIAVAGQGSIVADAADDTLTVASGTGITLTTNSSTDTLTITNSAPDQTVVLTAGTGISTSGTYPSFTITNTAPDQTVALTAGTGITTSGTYPSFTITNNDRGSSQNIFKNLAVSGQSTIVADNNDDTLTVASGTGISLTTNSVSDTLTITNTAPDQVVSISAGTGISVSGTYPSFTVTNTAPDQVVSITGAGTSVVTGTYPNFTITSNDQYVGTVTSVDLTAGTGITPGQTTIVASTNNDTFTVKPGSGISATTLGNDITISNTDPGSAQNIFKNIAVAGQNTIVADGNNDVLNFVSGTGISLTTNDTTDSLTVTNSAPDQVVALSSGTGISVSGTYPNFTITNTSPSSGGTVTGTGTTNYVTKWTTSSNIGDSQIFDNGTNVGIGTTTLTQKFHVNGNIVLGDVLYLNSANGAIWNSANGALRFGTNATERARFDATGNFGIGTTSPNSQLQVGSSNFAITGRTSAVYGAASETIFTVGVSGVDYPQLLNFGVNQSGLYSTISARQFTVATENKLILQPNGGNVGIGTTNPGAKLDVATNSSGTTIIVGRGNGQSSIKANSDNGGYLALDSTGGELILNHYSSANIWMVTGGGNVGIGTTSPVNKLQIGSVPSYSGNPFAIGNGTDQFAIFQGSSFTQFYTNGGFLFATNNTESMRITAAGNVGIGTTSPGAKLDVQTSSTNLGLRLGNANGTNWDFYSYNDSNLWINNTTGNKLIILNNGNVGIGTTSPDAKLVIAGSGTGLAKIGDAGFGSGNYTGISLNGTLSTGSYNFLSSPTDSALYINRPIGSTIRFSENNNYQVIIAAGGNVGIGTTSPGAKLNVSGGFIRVEGTSTDQYFLEGVRTGVSTTLRIYDNSSIPFYDSYGSMYFRANQNGGSGGIIGFYGGAATFSNSVTANSFIKTSGTASQYLMADGSVTTTSNVAPRYVATVNVSQTAYTQICTISGNSLASAVNMSIQGTSGAVVVNVTAQILVNHYQDISITTTSGFYSQLNLRVISNNNESYSVEAQVISGVGATTDLNIEVFPLNGESVTFGGSPTTPGTTLVHTTRQGLYVSASEPISISSSGDIYAATNVGIGTTSPTNPLHILRSANSVLLDGVKVSRDPSTTSSAIFNAFGGATNIIANSGSTSSFSPILFSTSDNTTTNELMRITGAGNVGIGTTSPASPAGYIAETIDGTNGSFTEYRQNGTALFRIGADGSRPFLYGMTNAPMDFYTNNAQRMRITSDGNVGIGTTSPATRLHVDASGHAMVVSNDTGNRRIYFGTGGTGEPDIQATLSNGTARQLSINAAGGNVGIGTTTPNVELAVYQSSTARIHLQNSTSGTASTDGLQIALSGVDGYLWNWENGSTIFATNNAERMRITSSGNVGIGTTSPGAKLQVSGGGISIDGYSAPSSGQSLEMGYVSTYGQINSYNRTASAYTQLRIDGLTTIINSGSGGNVGIGTTSPGSLLQVGVGNATANSLVRLGVGYDTIRSSRGGIDWHDGSNVTGKIHTEYDGTMVSMVFGSLYNSGYNSNNLMIIRGNGNVGIGTTTPNGKLQVDGDFYVNGIDRKIMNYNGAVDYGTLTNNSVRFNQNGAEIARISTAGNVGIGTTSPGTKLDVTGIARATSLSTVSGLGLNVAGYAYLSQSLSGVMTFLGHNVRASDSVANTAVVQNASWISSLIKLYYNEGITFHTDTTVYAAGATYPLSTTERMRIQTNGNVGIGTTSAFSRFTVSGALTASSSQISIVNTEGGHAIIRAGIAGISNSGISLVTANVDGSSQNVRMVVSATGNVGIGTTSPSASLHVAASSGVIFGATTGAVGTSQITTASAGSPVSSRFAFGTDGSGWQYRIAKNTAGTIADLVTVSDNGSVGIGSTAPSSLLEIAGASPVLTINRTSGTSSTINFNSSGNNFASIISNPSNGENRFSIGPAAAWGGFHTFYTDTSERMRITAAGNVGIGTTTPGASIHVAGAINSTPTGDGFLAGIQSGYAVIHLNGSAATGSLIDFSVSGTDTKGRILYDNTNNYFGFNTNGSERLRITSTGDVGIGTTSPSAKLHVIGNATVSATLSTANAKISGTLTDSFNQVGTAGQVLSSTGTGIEWITGGGGGGGSTIIVKDEGTTIGSSFTTLDFVGNNIQASASGSTAVVTAYNNAGTGSLYANDTTTQYAPGATFADVEINATTVYAAAPDTAGTSQKLIAIVTFGVDNVSDFDGFNNFDFRLYNSSGSTAVPDTTHSWCSYMSKGEFEKRTVFTFHIPLYDGVGGSDNISVQAKQSTAYTPEIYYCALTLIEGTN